MFHLINNVLYDEQGRKAFETHSRISGYIIRPGNKNAYKVDYKIEGDCIYAWVGGDYRLVYDGSTESNFTIEVPIFILEEPNAFFNRIEYGSCNELNHFYIGFTTLFLFASGAVIYPKRSIFNELFEPGEEKYYVYKQPDLEALRNKDKIEIKRIYESKEEYLKTKSKRKKYLEDLYKYLTYLTNDKFNIDYIDADKSKEYYDYQSDMIAFELRDVQIEKPIESKYNRSQGLEETEYYHVDRMTFALPVTQDYEIDSLKFINNHKILFTKAAHPHVNTTKLNEIIDICLGQRATDLSLLFDRIEDKEDPEDVAEDIVFIIKNIAKTHAGSPHYNFSNMLSYISADIDIENDCSEYYQFISYLKAEEKLFYLNKEISERKIKDEIQKVTTKKYWFKGENQCTYQWFEHIEPIRTSKCQPKLELTKDRTSEIRAVSDITPGALQNIEALQRNQQGRMVRTYLL